MLCECPRVCDSLCVRVSVSVCSRVFLSMSLFSITFLASHDCGLVQDLSREEKRDVLNVEPDEIVRFLPFDSDDLLLNDAAEAKLEEILNNRSVQLRAPSFS